MDIELFKKVMKELSPYLYNIISIFRENQCCILRFSHLLGIVQNTYTIVSTNGHFLSEENSEKIVRSGLNKLIISLDGLIRKPIRPTG